MEDGIGRASEATRQGLDAMDQTNGTRETSDNKGAKLLRETQEPMVHKHNLQKLTGIKYESRKMSEFID